MLSFWKHTITVNLKKFYSHTIFRLYTSGKFFIVKYINICIIYLHVIETCLEVATATFYFYPSKNPSDVMKNILNAISIYSWKKKSSLTNIRNKRVIRKKYLYCFDVMKTAILFLQKFVIFNMIIDSCFVEKWGTVERAMRCVCKNLLNLDC